MPDAPEPPQQPEEPPHELSRSMRNALIQIADMRAKMEELAEAKRQRKEAEKGENQPV